MSVREDAVVAAHVAYPDADVVLVRNDRNEPMVMGIAGNGLRAMARTPFAQGYQAGYAAALADLPTALGRVMCTVCEDDGEFIQSPVDSWWAHKNHPADHHDYAPGLRP